MGFFSELSNKLIIRAQSNKLAIKYWGVNIIIPVKFILPTGTEVLLVVLKGIKMSEMSTKILK